MAAYRFPYLLAGGSLVLKQDSDYYEHFYRQLEPWVHYIPVKKDISDLVEQLEWAKRNDDKAREMAENAAQFVQDHLLPEQLYCYMYQLLKVCTYIGEFLVWVSTSCNTIGSVAT